MGNCCTSKDGLHVRGGPIKRDEDKTQEDYRKEFRGSIIDLEYFYNEDPVHRRSLIKKMKVSKLNPRKSESEVERNLIVSMATIVCENIQIRYAFEKTLGDGAFGKVKVASLHENKNKKFAIKSIPREILDKNINKVVNSKADLDESSSDSDSSDEGNFKYM